ncbi:hypothetical protein [Sinorhizobium sp. BG8]|uniref:hypothetical protein n=1 Tax=Sinorhizobium sp. BG8 TaxID=2613773 RepID=UPI00193D11F6|nr:hypothetical protein [Sinorhizobium sp. BG8]QRM53545.1 hypothetical protein F3Y30_02420 [Sinorhizobium sp. BG8]
MNTAKVKKRELKMDAAANPGSFSQLPDSLPRNQYVPTLFSFGSCRFKHDFGTDGNFACGGRSSVLPKAPAKRMLAIGFVRCGAQLKPNARG